MGKHKNSGERARLRAEEAMRRMDVLRPQIEFYREELQRLRVLYEQESQLIRGYARRGIVTEEERDSYRLNNEPHPNVTARIKIERGRKAGYGEDIVAGLRSGHPGVCWDATTQKWRVTIKSQGKTIRLGRYADLDEAIAVREKAEKEIKNV